MAVEIGRGDGMDRERTALEGWQLSGPFLIVGWWKNTKKTEVETRRIELATGVQTALVELANSCREDALGRDWKKYDPDDVIDEKTEAFWYPHDFSASVNRSTRVDDDDEVDLSVVVEKVLSSNQIIESLSMEELQKRILFYAVCFGNATPDSTIGFIRRHSIGVATKDPGLAGIFDGHELKAVDRGAALLLIDSEFEVICMQNGCVLLDNDTIDRLFADMEVRAQRFPNRVAALVSGLQKLNVPVSSTFASSLEHLGQRKRSLMQKVERMVARGVSDRLHPDILRTHMQDMGLDEGTYLNSQGQLEVRSDLVEHVPTWMTLINVLDQRLFKQAFDGEVKVAERESSVGGEGDG